MELKDIYKDIYETGKNLVKEAASAAKEKELREKAVKYTADFAKETAHVAETVSKAAAQKTREYVKENHIGSKGAYIAQLEKQLEEKDREIRILKRKLAKSSWKSEKRG